jgi:hypothetical protein
VPEFGKGFFGMLSLEGFGVVVVVGAATTTKTTTAKSRSSAWWVVCVYVCVETVALALPAFFYSDEFASFVVGGGRRGSGGGGGRGGAAIVAADTLEDGGTGPSGRLRFCLRMYVCFCMSEWVRQILTNVCGSLPLHNTHTHACTHRDSHHNVMTLTIFQFLWQSQDEACLVHRQEVAQEADDHNHHQAHIVLSTVLNVPG